MKKNIVNIIFSVLVLTAFMIFPQFSSSAYGQADDTDEWKFVVTPYLWMAGLEGDVTVRGIESSVDVEFSDIFEALDFGFLMYLEAQKGKWGIYLDPTYMALSSEEQAGPIDIDVDLKQWIFEFGGLYNIGQWALGDKTVSLEILAGGRYVSVDAEMDISGSGPLGLDANVEYSKDWVDPIVGVRFKTDLTDKVPLILKGDIGGFDVGSDFAWSIMASLGYRLSERTTLWAAYRHLDIDYDDGSGNDLFEFDVVMSGPALGVGFSF